MNMKEAIEKSRSYRRFCEARAVTPDEMRELLASMRNLPSGGNIQPIRYRPVTEENEKSALFPALGWAAALPDWDGPAPGERPGGYVVLCLDISLAKPVSQIDLGIAAQSFLLLATEMGLGGCMLKNFNRETVARALDIDHDRYSPELVIAVGKPAENVRIIPLPDSGDVRYFRDEAGTHFVPKRSLDELIIG